MEANNTISIYANPVLGLSLALEKQLEQIRQAQEYMAKQYTMAISMALRSPVIELAESIRVSQEAFAKSLLRAVNPFFITFTPSIEVQEAEIVEVKEVEMGIKDITTLEGGLFTFEGKIIRTISTNSKQGKFLEMLLTYKDNYVSDQVSVKKLDIPDIDRGMSYIRRDLKRDLLNSNLKIDLHRHTKKGYSLVSVKRLLN